MWEGIRTTHKTIFRVPHRSRLHPFSSTLILAVSVCIKNKEFKDIVFLFEFFLTQKNTDGSRSQTHDRGEWMGWITLLDTMDPLDDHLWFVDVFICRWLCRHRSQDTLVIYILLSSHMTSWITHNDVYIWFRLVTYHILHSIPQSRTSKSFTRLVWCTPNGLFVEKDWRNFVFISSRIKNGVWGCCCFL